jgi:hypothetical protein
MVSAHRLPLGLYKRHGHSTTAVGVGNELDMNLKKRVRILADKLNR